MNPEEDAAIIKEHARLHVRVMKLKAVEGVDGQKYIRRDDVIDLLALTETMNASRPECSPKLKKQ